MKTYIMVGPGRMVPNATGAWVDADEAKTEVEHLKLLVDMQASHCARLQSELSAMQARAERAQKVVAAVRHSMGCAGVWMIGCACENLWHKAMADAMNKYDTARRDAGEGDGSG